MIVSGVIFVVLLGASITVIALAVIAVIDEMRRKK